MTRQAPPDAAWYPDTTRPKNETAPEVLDMKVTLGAHRQSLSLFLKSENYNKMSTFLVFMWVAPRDKAMTRLSSREKGLKSQLVAPHSLIYVRPLKPYWLVA